MSLSKAGVDEVLGNYKIGTKVPPEAKEFPIMARDGILTQLAEFFPDELSDLVLEIERLKAQK